MKKWTGRSASVTVNGVLCHFSDWEFDATRNEVDATDMMSGPYGEMLSGFRKGSISLSGPLDTDSAYIDPDDTCVIVLGIGGGNSVSCTCVVTGNNIKQGTKDMARYALKAKVTGTPTFVLGI